MIPVVLPSEVLASEDELVVSLLGSGVGLTPVLVRSMPPVLARSMADKGLPCIFRVVHLGAPTG